MHTAGSAWRGSGRSALVVGSRCTGHGRTARQVHRLTAPSMRTAVALTPHAVGAPMVMTPRAAVVTPRAVGVAMWAVRTAMCHRRRVAAAPAAVLAADSANAAPPFLAKLVLPTPRPMRAHPSPPFQAKLVLPTPVSMRARARPRVAKQISRWAGWTGRVLVDFRRAPEFSIVRQRLLAHHTPKVEAMTNRLRFEALCSHCHTLPHPDSRLQRWQTARCTAELEAALHVSQLVQAVPTTKEALPLFCRRCKTTTQVARAASEAPAVGLTGSPQVFPRATRDALPRAAPRRALHRRLCHRLRKLWLLKSRGQIGHTWLTLVKLLHERHLCHGSWGAYRCQNADLHIMRRPI